MGILKALGIRMRAEVEAVPEGHGLTARDGAPVMSRADPVTGRALTFDRRGFDGRGTRDEERVRKLRRRR